MKKYLHTCILAVGLTFLLTAGAQAHRFWMLPSATVFSGEDVWLTVDAAVSNDLFYFNHHPLRLDHLKVMAPDGSELEIQNASVGKYRSTFDVPLTQAGTYKLALASDSMFARYTLNGDQKRWRGTAETLSEIPANAEEVNVRHAQRRVEVFATVGAPSETVLKLTGKGLEMAPITHPNDLFAGETGRFRLTLDGKPAADVEVEVVRGGTRYRDDVGAIHAKTNAEGIFEVKWPEPGMYWLNAETQAPSSMQGVSGRSASYTATLEVLPQ
jgi:uncharacterized GH25 family protein